MTDTLLTDADAEVLRLWPEGPPGAPRELPPRSRWRNAVPGGRETWMLRNVSDPALHVFRPDPGLANGWGVIVCPGGGWRILAWEHEGEEIARRLAAQGYAAFVLEYRLHRTPSDRQRFLEQAAALARRIAGRLFGPSARRTLGDLLADPQVIAGRAMAAEDGRRALALVRERADDLGVRPGQVGLMGFSAGAFLVADVALSTDGPPPAFVAPIYGGDLAGRPVGPDAPPLFAAVAQDDHLFVQTSLALTQAWTDAGRPAELHLFARGGHGFGLTEQGLPVDRWFELFEAWLVALRRDG